MSDAREPEADRARAWRRAALEAVCDRIEPWEHGTVMRASRYPSYYDFNVVWVDGDPGLSADELIAVADAELAGLDHRRLDFELAEAAERVRTELEAARWEATRLAWMRHTEPLPPGPAVEVEEVNTTRCSICGSAGIAEDFPGHDSDAYLAKRARSR